MLPADASYPFCMGGVDLYAICSGSNYGIGVVTNIGHTENFAAQYVVLQDINVYFVTFYNFPCRLKREWGYLNVFRVSMFGL